MGQVVNFRMVYDNKTHKKKGYAFCEYVDESSAASAKRNLNDRDLNGRKLRVDFADNNQINIPSDEREKCLKSVKFFVEFFVMLFCTKLPCQILNPITRIL